MQKSKQAPGLTGMRAFTLIWLGQFLSFIGTGMSRFAISLWAWELTGQATALALVQFFAAAPTILLSPLAGALADRWNRKLVMMISDLAAGLSTIALLLLSWNGTLEIWHVYAASAFAGAFEAFQFPAYSAAITTMVDKKQYARTSAMLGLANAASNIIAPIGAAALYGLIQLNGILLIDVVSFIFGVGVLFFVYIPSPRKSQDGIDSQGGIFQEATYGFRYIWRRKPLFSVQMVFFWGNLLFAFVIVLLNPYILARTGNDEVTLSLVSATMGLGGVLGGIALTAWGGPKRRINGVLLGFLVWGIFGALMLGLSQSLIGWVIGVFIGNACGPLINASNQAIWQSKVPPDVQGKVFAVRRIIAQVTFPLASFIAGPLADYIFEPAMQPGGALVPIFGGLVGSGPGAGMGLLFVLVGIAQIVVVAAAYSLPIIREVEDRIQDFEDGPSEEAEPAIQVA
ncbi:MFS transporter [Phototrophicus methaneseepsis]|uniref:MFS transporter n=1 Tax=Phototrophicus methaneseepsis TaxID=2710758 RepID=A0A7S8E8U4_9CHLR|nr:MFS transporter [Phototrophicus methaneseepsis]QPC82492.1 MFS transporter [Phototrophicus methaneseepsis]